MLISKYKQLIWAIYLLLGLGYFSAMSNLEIHYFWKSLIAFIPIQIGALVYVHTVLSKGKRKQEINDSDLVTDSAFNNTLKPISKS